MNSSILWKMCLTLFVVGWMAFSLVPLEDTPFEDYAAEIVPAHKEEFVALLQEAEQKVVDGGYTSTYIALRDIVNDREIDLNKFFPPPEWEVTSTNILERKNNLILKEILRQSKGELKQGLDLAGGISATYRINADEIEQGALQEEVRHARDVIAERVNALGLTEPVVRIKGAERIEVQMPGVSTKDDPNIVNEIGRPAFLEFSEVHPTQVPFSDDDTPPPGYRLVTMELEDKKAGEVYYDHLFVTDIPFMTGEIIERAGATLDETGLNWQVNMNFTTLGDKKFAEVTGEMAAAGGGRLAIILDGELQSAPTVSERISGSARITGQFTQAEARNLANVLNNPLKVGMTVEEMSEVSPTLAADSRDASIMAGVVGACLVIAFVIIYYQFGGLIAVVSVLANILIVLGTLAALDATITLPGVAALVLTIGMAVDAQILIFERIREELKEGKHLPFAVEAGYGKAFSTIVDANVTTLITALILMWLGSGPIQGFGITLAIGILGSMFCALIVTRWIVELLVNTGVIKTLFRKNFMIRLKGGQVIDFLAKRKPAFITSWIIVLVGIGVTAVKWDKIFGIDFTGGEEISLGYEERLTNEQIGAVADDLQLGEVNVAYTQVLGGESQIKIQIPGRGTPGELSKTTGTKFVEALQARNPDFNLTVVREPSVTPGEPVRETFTVSADQSLNDLDYQAVQEDLLIDTVMMADVGEEGRNMKRITLEYPPQTFGLKFTNALQQAYPDAGIEYLGEIVIGAAVGDEVKQSAYLSIAVALCGILLYVALRFELGYGVGATVATVHDILMSVGIYVLLGGQFSAPMVAAVLMILGYSINDTIVVFDRIREELDLHPGMTLRDVVNLAITRTLSRTVLTSLTTLLATIALFIWGAGVVRDFALVFMIGIFTGTFSSIFIASPIFFWYHKGDRKSVEEQDDTLPTYDWDAGNEKA